MSDLRNESSRDLPEIGSLWRHPMLRDRWRVETVGRRYIRLRSVIPALGPTSVPIGQWPGKWERS